MVSCSLVISARVTDDVRRRSAAWVENPCVSDGRGGVVIKANLLEWLYSLHM